MNRAASPRLRALVLAGSVLISIVVVWVFLGGQADPATTKIEDRRADFQRLLAERRTNPGVPAAEGPGLVREPLERAVAERLFATLRYASYEYDPHAYFRRVGGYHSDKEFPEFPGGRVIIRTNSLGLREDGELRETPPDLRVLVAGDSQTEGVCGNSESVPGVLEQLLATRHAGESVEVVNAAVGAYGPYSYLGTLERFGYLKPDVFVMVVYGGNDFYDLMRLQRYFNRREHGNSRPHDLMAIAEELSALNIMPAQFTQLCYFMNNPLDIPIAIETLSAITLEVSRFCVEHEVAPLFVFLPGPMSGQPHLYPDETQAFLDVAEVDAGSLELFDLFGDAFLAFLAEHELPHVDLRPGFRSSEERFFWDEDRHLNLRGNRLVAEALAGAIAELLDGERSD